MSLISDSESVDFVENLLLRVTSWDVEAGPSRHEMMVAQWHRSECFMGCERLELTLESNFDNRVKHKVHIVILSSTWYFHEKERENWKISGILYPANDPLGIRDDNPERLFSMVYNVRTRKGTLRIVTKQGIR